MIDTHAHLDALDDASGAVARAREAGVDRIVAIGSGLTSARKTLDLASREDGVFVAIGVHPHQAADGESLEGLAVLVDGEVVAVGEIGLDFYRDYAPRDDQRRVFSGQLRLAEELGKAVIVHSRDGAERLTGELGVDPARVHVIAHGAFAHLAAPEPVAGMPPFETEAPVVLCFGLMRPYKGIDLLLEAWQGIEEAELWIAGMPRMDIAPLMAAAPAGVRFVPRFIGDRELPAYFRRADLVVLPYREIDQSGVLFTALAFGKPLLLSDVGGFPEVAETGAARTFPAGDGRALHEALRELLADPGTLAAMAARSRAAAAGPYSWAAAGRRTLELYESLAGVEPRR